MTTATISRRTLLALPVFNFNCKLAFHGPNYCYVWKCSVCGLSVCYQGYHLYYSPIVGYGKCCRNIGWPKPGGSTA